MIEARADPGPPLGEAELNTIGYVLSRYGADATRSPGSSVRIQTAWIEDYFRATAGPDEDEDVVLDVAAVAKWLSGAERTRDAAALPDTPAQLAERLDQLRAKVAEGA